MHYYKLIKPFIYLKYILNLIFEAGIYVFYDRKKLQN